MVRIGCGLNYYPDTDRFLLATVEYRHLESEFFMELDDARLFTQNWNSDIFHCGLGAETRFLSWMTLRASCSWEYLYFTESFENPENIEGNPEDGNSESAYLHINLGTGLHFGRYNVDLALTNKFPTTPAGFVGYADFQDDRNWLTATLRAEF